MTVVYFTHKPMDKGVIESVSDCVSAHNPPFMGGVFVHGSLLGQRSRELWYHGPVPDKNSPTGVSSLQYLGGVTYKDGLAGLTAEVAESIAEKGLVFVGVEDMKPFALKMEAHGYEVRQLV